MEHVKDRPAAQPAVKPAESVEQVLGHLYSLSQDEQLSAFRTIATVVLGRLQEPQRERFIANLRGVPRGEAKLSEPASAGPVEPKEKVIRDALEQPFQTQQHLVHKAAPRVVAGLMPNDRERFLRELSQEIGAIEQGAPVQL